MPLRLSIKLPSHLMTLLQKEIIALCPSTPLQPIVTNPILLAPLPPSKYLPFSSDCSNKDFILQDYKLVKNTVVGRLTFDSQWFFTVHLFSLPVAVPFPDMPLAFSPLQSKPSAFLVTDSDTNKVFTYEHQMNCFLDAQLNKLNLEKDSLAPSHLSQPLPDQLSETAADGAMSLLRPLFSDIVWEPVTLAEKLRNNRTITNKDLAMLHLASMGLVEIEKT